MSAAVVCPWCGHEAPGTTAVGTAPSAPEPGALALCMECSRWGVLGEPGEPVTRATEQDLADAGITPEVLAAMRAVLANRVLFEQEPEQ